MAIPIHNHRTANSWKCKRPGQVTIKIITGKRAAVGGGMHAAEMVLSDRELGRVVQVLAPNQTPGGPVELRFTNWKSSDSKNSAREFSMGRSNCRAQALFSVKEPTTVAVPLLSNCDRVTLPGKTASKTRANPPVGVTRPNLTPPRAVVKVDLGSVEDQMFDPEASKAAAVGT